MVPSSNLGQVIYLESGEVGRESCETQPLATSINTNIKIKSILNTSKKEDFELKSIYFLEQKNLEKYLFEKFSKHYAKEMINSLKKVFVGHKVETLEDFKRIIDNKKINERSGKTSFRVFLNYLEYKELIQDDILIKLRKKIKLNISSNVDTYIPKVEDIKNSISIINEKYSKEFEVFYRLILESGCRPVEIEEFILNFDSKKVEEYDNTIVYRNFYLRNTKNSAMSKVYLNQNIFSIL
jgi:intergrase/recombinase